MIILKKARKSERVEALLLNAIVPVSKSDILDKVPDISVKTVELVLRNLLKEGKIVKIGSYRDARYMKKTKLESQAGAERLSNSGIKPVVLEQIRSHAIKCGIHTVILFGSRARGIFHRDSDIDLAVSGGNTDLFRLAVEEETDTLLTFDVVDLDHTSNEELLDEIRKEGVALYEEV